MSGLGRAPGAAAQADAAAGLRAAMRGVVRAGEPMAPHTTIRIGGPALLYAEPATVPDLRSAIAWAEGAGLQWRVVGLGSNLLCPEAGWPGLVLRLSACCRDVRWEGDGLIAGGGAHLAPLVQEAARRGLAGLEAVAGVPGTVGGALAMNAGTSVGDMAGIAEWARVLTVSGDVQTWDRAELGFGYRHSRLQDEAAVVLAAALRLRAGDASALMGDLRQRAARRRATQPLEVPSAGSIWRNPPGDYAGRLVDAAGAKGLRAGDAEVSPKHGNFIVNRGRATSDEVLSLMAQVRRRVQAGAGVRLQAEIRWLSGQGELEERLGGL